MIIIYIILGFLAFIVLTLGIFILTWAIGHAILQITLNKLENELMEETYECNKIMMERFKKKNAES